MSHVVIVGAGPTGATLAYLLAQHQIEVTLIESAASFERVFRGEGLMPGGLQALEQMQLLDLLQHIPHRQIQAWQFVIDGYPILNVAEPESLGVYRPTIIPQPAFLEAVLQKAQAYPTFRFLQATVQDLLDKNQRIGGVVVRQAGQEQTIAADLVIGADGRGSTVRRLAALPLKKLDYDTDVLWLRMAAALPEPAQKIFYGFIRGAESLGAYTSWDDSIKFAYLLPRHQTLNWKAVDWAQRMATIVPPWFAEHIQTRAATLEPPVLLNVVFGRCPNWSRAGVLLLGDAAHPMAPIRAQGINVALRDSIVAANHLIPLLKPGAKPDRLDQALLQIQAEREPEIQRAQKLQRQEQHQATLLCRFDLLRYLLTRTSPILRPVIEQRWLARQQDLRFGLQPVKLLNFELD